MGKYKKPELTNCEEIVMKIVWDSEEPLICSDVVERLESEYGINYSKTTVYTFLEHLKRKGYIQVKKRGIIFYSPIKSMDDYRKKKLKEILESYYKDDCTKMIEDLRELGWQ